MKRFPLISFFVLVLLFGFSISKAAENYNVLNVFGQLKLKATGKIIAKGDVISSEAQIIFLTLDSKAALFSPSKGRFTLKALPDLKPTGGEFLAYVKNSLIPPTQMLATRAGNILNRVDFKNYFEAGPFLIVSPVKVAISAETFPQNNLSFFFLRCEWNGQEVNKKLNSENGKMILDPANILIVDGNPVEADEMSNFRFYYMEGETKISTFLCEFQPVFAELEALKAELRSYRDELLESGKTDIQIKEEIKSYLSDYYGEMESNSFDEFWTDLNNE